MNIKKPDLDSIISNLYGHTLIKYKNVKTAYSIFTPFKNIETNQIIYFYLFKVSARNHLSEGTINYALKKYNPFLSKVEFLLIEKNFDWTYYLIKSYGYLISIDELVTLKKECQEVMEKEYILKTIEFLISIYKAKKWTYFPQLTPKSLGINQQGMIKICDYEFYCKKQFQMRSLTENICSCLNPMIKIAFLKSSSRILPSENQFQRLIDYYGQSFAKLIKSLVLDPMQHMEKQGVHNGQGKQINIFKIQEALSNYYKTAEQDTNTTLNETYQEDFKNIKQNSKKCRESDLITNDSIKEPFLLRDETKKNRRKIFIKASSAVMIGLLVLAGALFFMAYYQKEIICDVGTFKAKDKNQCLSCSQGCLRCDSQTRSSCFSCSGKMYLVLNDEKDTMGACQSTCIGTILRSNLCLKSKNPSSKLQKRNLTLIS